MFSRFFTEGFKRKGLLVGATIIPLATVTVTTAQCYRNMASGDNWKTASSAYEFDFIDIDGNPQSMARYKGHVMIVVNVATKWSKTPVNYTQLTALHEKYGGTQGLRVLGFPCNQFGGQEPGTEAEIKAFARGYNAQWDLASKVNVNGDDAHPLWKYMKSKQGGTLGSFIKWNFTKFVIDKNGQIVGRYGPQTNPFEMEKDLNKFFAQ